MTNNNPTNHILFSYIFDKKGNAKKINGDEVAQQLKNPNLSWVHLDANNKNTAKWLNDKVDYLDHLIINALIAEDPRPRILKFDHGILVILRGLNYNKNSKSSDMVSIRMWIDKERIISIQKRPMKSIYEIENTLNEGVLNISDSGIFLLNIIKLTINDIANYIYSTGEKIDDIEQKVIISRNMKYRDTILNTRSQLTISKRYLTPLKDVIIQTCSLEYDWINDFHIRNFHESSDQIIHVIEEVDEVLIRAKILHDELTHTLNEKINRNMFKISIIAMIFMPLTFITSLFGMNFQRIPGSDNPNGFYLICLVLLMITALQMLFFRKKDWF